MYWTLSAILVADLALTAAHSYQEYRGKLWRYFGDIAGVEIPDGFGFWSFTVGLTLSLWTLAIVGIGLGCPFALGLLIGVRLGDAAFSHIGPWAMRYRPNPGLGTAYLYPIEAMGLCLLAPASVATVIGLAIGFYAFGSILPGLELLRDIFPKLRQPRWIPGT